MLGAFLFTGSAPWLVCPFTVILNVDACNIDFEEVSASGVKPSHTKMEIADMLEIRIGKGSLQLKVRRDSPILNFWCEWSMF